MHTRATQFVAKTLLFVFAMIVMSCPSSWAFWFFTKKSAYEGHPRYEHHNEKGRLDWEHIFITDTNQEVYLKYHDNQRVAEEIHYVQYPDKGLYDRYREGVTKRYDRRGRLLSEQPYHKDRLHGVSKRYYPNGKLKSVEHYEEGRPHGPSRTYYENGVLKTALQYSQGRLDGWARTFYPNGHIESQRYYHHNKVVGVRQDYFPNGRVKAVSRYQPHKGFYKVRQLSETGMIRQERLKDHSGGYERVYHPNGHLRSVAIQKNGAFYSKHLFDKNGRLKVQITVPSNSSLDPSI